MNKLIEQINKRNLLKLQAQQAIQKLFNIDKTMIIGERIATKSTYFLKREAVYSLIRQQLNIGWSPITCILLREALDEAGAKTINQQGYHFFVNISPINKEAFTIPDVSFNDAGDKNGVQ